MTIVDTNKWRQGVLFSAPSICVAWNKSFVSKTGELVVDLDKRFPRLGEKFVVISQTCDIQAEEEPYVEVLLCTPTNIFKQKNRDYLARVDRNSARRFVIDFTIGLVAEAKYRVPLDKELLNVQIPEPWPSSPERFERFVRWLARRYDRPAIPDILVNTFQVPINNLLDQIDTSNTAVGRAFSDAVHELRVNLPESEDPPFNLKLVVMLKRDALSVQEADAISIVTDAIQASLDPTIICLSPDDVLLRTDEEISLAEHQATRPLFLEFLTYKGEEIEGIKGFNRT